MQKIKRSWLNDVSMSYSEYRELLDDLLLANKTTGDDQSEERISYASLNQKRMQRLDKATMPTGLSSFKINAKVGVMIITEGWCGDSAQIVPWFEQYLELYQPEVKSYFILRDDNPQVMDSFLTNGTRGIPKFVFFNEETLDVLALWGPRPEKIQQWFLSMKEEQPGLSKDEYGLQLHQFYTKDKGHEIIADLQRVFQTLSV